MVLQRSPPSSYQTRSNTSYQTRSNTRASTNNNNFNSNKRNKSTESRKCVTSTSKCVCSVCNHQVANVDSIQCDLCQIWFHIECVQLSKFEHEQISKLGEDTKWFCKDCKTCFNSMKDER